MGLVDLMGSPLRHALADERWFERALALLVVLACAVGVSSNGADPDLWGHVWYGRDTLNHGLVDECTYSYAAAGHRWINHENLAEIALAWGADYLGPRGMLVAKCGLGLAALGLVLQRAIRRGLGMIPIAMAALLIAVGLSPHWTMRPQIFTYFLYALVLACTEEAFRDWPTRARWGWWKRQPDSVEPPSTAVQLTVHYQWLWCVPPLIVVATNTHGGFLAIGAVFVAYLGLRSVEGLAYAGRSAWPLVLRLSIVAGATAGATILNPYGLEYHVWLFHDLSVPRPEILEWHRPDWSSTYTLPLVLLIGASVGCLTLSRKQFDGTHLVVLGLTLWQSIEHLRHLPFFALAWGMWMLPHLDSVWSRFVPTTNGRHGTDMSPRSRLAFIGIMLAVAILIGVKLTSRFQELRVPRDEYPVSAFEYIADRGLNGRMVCTFNWAQYALAAFGPQAADEPGILVHSDGRLRTCYPQEIIDMHFDLILGNAPEMRQRSEFSPPYDPGRILSFRDPTLVLLDRGQEPAQEVMRAHASDWVLLYQDGLAQLWGRASVFDDPQNPTYVPPDQRSISDAPQRGSVPWPAIPAARQPTAKRGPTPLKSVPGYELSYLWPPGSRS